MNKIHPKLLLTGPPGCGKTSIIRKVLDRISSPATGFYTEEVRGKDGKRVGFDVVTLDGRRGTLARASIKGPRVGKYGVDLRFLECTVLSELRSEQKDLVVIDEIGKMECLSNVFIEVVRGVLNGPTTLLGTVAQAGWGFIEEARNHPDVELILVAKSNRDRLVGEITDKIERRKEKG